MTSMLFVRYAREKKKAVTEAAFSLNELSTQEAHDNVTPIPYVRPNTSTATLLTDAEPKKWKNLCWTMDLTWKGSAS